ncbi:hypothetical protein A3Q56_00930 [Intoshia linei]|uniref:Helicase C-terminal domain-containing protein n=1 Tax=Intoshia linei TaxID=1819745 RepID=A0A177BAE9_9BILA|nr:hypothetical protein A3Q56_00930 [Intoshia linei]
MNDGYIYIHSCIRLVNKACNRVVNYIHRHYNNNWTHFKFYTNIIFGMDKLDCTLVINFSIPRGADIKPSPEEYLRRIERTGRFGKKGIALNLIDSEYELESLMTIQKYYDTVIEELPHIKDIENIAGRYNKRSTHISPKLLEMRTILKLMFTREDRFKKGKDLHVPSPGAYNPKNIDPHVPSVNYLPNKLANGMNEKDLPRKNFLSVRNLKKETKYFKKRSKSTCFKDATNIPINNIHNKLYINKSEQNDNLLLKVEITSFKKQLFQSKILICELNKKLNHQNTLLTNIERNKQNEIKILQEKLFNDRNYYAELLDNIKSENSKNQNEIEILEEKLLDDRNYYSELLEKTKSTKIQNQIVNIEMIDKIKSTIKEFKNDFNYVYSNIESLHNILKKFTIIINESLNVYNDYSKQIENIHENVDTKNANIDKLIGNVVKLTGINADQCKKIENLSYENCTFQDFKDLYNILKNEYMNYQLTTNNQIKSLLEEKENLLSETNLPKINEIKSTVNILSDKLTMLTTQMDLKNQNLLKKEIEINDLKNSYSDLDDFKNLEIKNIQAEYTAKISEMASEIKVAHVNLNDNRRKWEMEKNRLLKMEQSDQKKKAMLSNKINMMNIKIKSLKEEEKELQNEKLLYAQSVNSKDNEIDLWKQRFNELDAKILPFSEILSNYDTERKLLIKNNKLTETELLNSAFDCGSKLGHCNFKQKIKYVANLKLSEAQLKLENMKLKTKFDESRRKIIALESQVRIISGKNKFDPKNAFKCNNTEVRKVHFVTNESKPYVKRRSLTPEPCSRSNKSVLFDKYDTNYFTTKSSSIPQLNKYNYDYRNGRQYRNDFSHQSTSDGKYNRNRNRFNDNFYNSYNHDYHKYNQLPNQNIYQDRSQSNFKDTYQNYDSHQRYNYQNANLKYGQNSVKYEIDKLKKDINEKEYILNSRNERFVEMEQNYEKILSENDSLKNQLCHSMDSAANNINERVKCKDLLIQKLEQEKQNIYTDNIEMRDRLSKLEMEKNSFYNSRLANEESLNMFQQKLIDILKSSSVDFDRQLEDNNLCKDDILERVREAIMNSNNLRGRLDRYESEKSILKATISKLMDESSQEKVHISFANGEIAKWENKSKILDDDNHLLYSEIEDLKTRLCSVTSAWTETRDRLESRESSWLNERDKIIEHKARLENEITQFQGLYSKLKTLICENLRINGNVKTNTFGLDEDKFLFKVSSEIGILHDRISKNMDFENRTIDLTKKLEMEYNGHRDMEKNISLLEGDKMELKSEISRLHQQLEVADSIRKVHSDEKGEIHEFLNMIFLKFFQKDCLVNDFGNIINKIKILEQEMKIMSDIKHDETSSKRQQLSLLQQKNCLQRDTINAHEMKIKDLMNRISGLQVSLEEKHAIQHDSDVKGRKIKRTLDELHKTKRLFDDANLKLREYEMEGNSCNDLYHQLNENIKKCDQLKDENYQLRKRRDELEMLTKNIDMRNENLNSNKNNLHKAYSEIGNNREALRVITMRESDLTKFRTIIARMLGINVSELSKKFTDYDIYSRLEQLILLAQHYSKDGTSYSVDTKFHSKYDKHFIKGYQQPDNLTHTNFKNSKNRKMLTSKLPNRNKKPLSGRYDSRIY